MRLEVKNPLRLNDWEFSAFTYALGSWTLLVLALMIMGSKGLDVPFVRQMVVASYMVGAPGYLLLRVMGLRDMGTVKTLLLCVGLGAAALMGLGLAMNQTYLYFNWTNAFSSSSVITAIILVNALLLYLAWRKRGEERVTPTVDLSSYITTPAMVLYSIPLIAIVSTYVLNRSGDNLMQVVLLCMIGAGMVLVCWKRLVPKELYPLAILSFSLALLWHSSLVSFQMVEWADVSFEYWSANRSIIVGLWEPDLTQRTDTLLSLTILVPMIAVPAKIELITFFKIVFPILFSFVPLGVYHLAERRMDPRLAMISVFLMISYSIFYTEMLGLNRQIVAELFMVLAIVVLLDSELPSRARMALLTVFGVSLAVSHYGLLMIFVLCVVASLVILMMVSVLFRQRRLNLRGVAVLSAGLLFVIVLWFTDLSNSYIAKIMFDALDSVLEGLWALQGTESSAVFSIYNLSDLAIMDQVKGVIFYLILSLIVVAIVHQMFVVKGKDRFEPEYLALALVFLLVMVSGAYNSNVFGFISESRLIHITLIILAPLAALGCHTLVRGLSVGVLKRRESTARKAAAVLMALVVVFVLMVNSGVAGQLFGDTTVYELDPSASTRPTYSSMEGNAAEWANTKIGLDQYVRADAHEAYLMKMYTGTYWPLYTVNGHDVYPVLPHQTFYYYGTDNIEGMIWLEDRVNFRLNNTYVPIPTGYSFYMFSQNMVYNAQYTVYYYDNNV